MGLPQLETCCFLLDLKTGNIVIGCLNAAISFVLTVTMIVVAATMGAVKDNEDPEVAAAMSGLYAMSIILVFMYLAKFLFDVAFVYAVIVERAGMIKAYFVMWILIFLLSMFTFFVNVAHYNAFTITMKLFFIGVNIYAILLSHSFYKQLNEREIL